MSTRSFHAESRRANERHAGTGQLVRGAAEGSGVVSKAVRLILACLIFLGIVTGAVLLFQQVV